MMENIYSQHLINRIRSLSKIVAGGCLEFTGIKNNGGYGLISVKLGPGKHRMIPAHRALYMAVNNVLLPRDVFVCHTCDNPSCTNVDHLFVGTALDNNRDKVCKGRCAKSVKPHSRIRKYSDALIMQIKGESGTNKEIAAKYGISPGYISTLRSGKSKPLIKPHIIIGHE